jgi:serine/threonine protein kinase/Flp pilus assembly protein TadD
MALVAGVRLGRYEVLSKLGEGGMGEVYRARDLKLERDVAIKVLPDRIAADPTFIARFQREAKAVAALSHPNVMAIYDIAVEQDRTFAVMELLVGETLSSRLKSADLDWRTIVEIARAIVEGLSAAHAKGVIHRDIKPANVFLTSDGGIKILDFGLARSASRDTEIEPSSATLSFETQPGVLLGTVTHMSPEQVRGLPVDGRSDIFSFGCMLYEMLSGLSPFRRHTNMDSMAAILNDSPPPIPPSRKERPPELDRIIGRCLEKEPGNRYATTRELAAALRAIPRFEGAVDTAKHRTPDTLVHQDAGPRASRVASVAVLPFVNMSSDKENEYFSDGLAEELINVLSKVEGLQVASRTSAFAFKGRSEDVRRIGEQLNVRTVLEGSVRKSGSRLRIAAQLVNVSDGYQLWSDTYNRQLEDVFAIQDEIAQCIAQALRVVLTEKDKKALEKAPTADVQAYDCYLRGRKFFHEFRRPGFQKAREMFARAIEIDPGYARAYAGLADCHSLLCAYWETSPEHVKQADAASSKALDLAPELAEAHIARGLAVSLSKRFDEARAEFETAIRLNPNLFEAYYFYGRACQAQGRLEEAAQLYQRANALRPEDYQSHGHVAAIYKGLKRDAEADAADRKALEAAEKHLKTHPQDARALYLGAISWCRVGEPSKGLEWADRALQMDPHEPVTLYNVACLYALQGKLEEAIDCLESAVKCGFGHKEWIVNDSDLNSLHSHPRYQALLEKL